MRNKKGFTLVELIVVMFILLLLVLTAFPNFAGLSSNAKNKYDNTVCVLLKSAASMYVNNHLSEFNVQSKKITVGKLIDSEFLDADIKDSQGNEISRDDEITVTRTVNNGVTEYTYTCP